MQMQGRGEAPARLAWLFLAALRGGFGARSCCWHPNLGGSRSQLTWALRTVPCHARVLRGMLKAGTARVSGGDGRDAGVAAMPCSAWL